MSSANSATVSSSGESGTAGPACIPCSTMDPSFLLGRADAEKKIDSTLPLWEIGSNDVAPMFLSRKFVCKNFECALDSINAMGAIAERESHHPDFHLTGYRQVEVVIYTHKLNGITQSDVTLAEKIDGEVRIEYSPKWLRENPLASKTAKVKVVGA